MKPPKEVKKIIEAQDLPVAYRAWREGDAPPLPYAVYYAGKTNNFGADGKVYFSAQRYTIELYTEEKDPAVERALEDRLNAAGIFWTKDETYIESEHMNEIIYEIEV